MAARWGRGQEVVSEEPLVCAEYAAHYIPALQGIKENTAKPDQLPFLKTVATAKHFFDYDLEGVAPATRQQIDVNVSAHDQVAFFSPPFESAVRRGKTQSVMCTYTTQRCFGPLINFALEFCNVSIAGQG
jgi:beta-glucosidase-like glycosyl hydrolase